MTRLTLGMQLFYLLVWATEIGKTYLNIDPVTHHHSYQLAIVNTLDLLHMFELVFLFQVSEMHLAVCITIDMISRCCLLLSIMVVAL